jgi:hypothetical protein
VGHPREVDRAGGTGPRAGFTDVGPETDARAADRQSPGIAASRHRGIAASRHRGISKHDTGEHHSRTIHIE